MRRRLSCLLPLVCASLAGLACGSDLESGGPIGGPAIVDGEPSPSSSTSNPPGSDPSVNPPQNATSTGPVPADGREQPPTPTDVVGSDPNVVAPGEDDTSAPTPTAGCSAAALEAGDHEETLEHDGETREFLVHVPSSYDGSAPVPLVLDIHGLTSTATQQAAISGWRQKSDAEGFIAVFPQGLNNSWNAGELCCGGSQRSGVDDEGFMRAIVNRLTNEACIDARRVYATGLSNGGGMAHLLGCKAADVFAATAPVSMGNGALPCEPSRPVSVIMTRGTRDLLVSYDGGLFPGAEEDFSSWGDLNGCTSEVTTSAGGLCQTRASCEGGVQVTLCTLDAGHVLYQNADDFSVPDAAWEVFERQTLP